MSCLVAIWFLVALATVVRCRYVNEWNGPFDFQCPHHHVLSDISSVYENKMADRRWKFMCRKTATTSFCTESGYVSQLNQPINFMCPGNSVVVAMTSYSDVQRVDRRFGFKCCNVENSKPTECSVSDYVNEYGGKLTLMVPDNKAVNGVFSSYDERRKDRVWKFRICSL